MTNERTNSDGITQRPNAIRRTLLKAGWATPVIIAVPLPVHAQTSNGGVQEETVLSCSAIDSRFNDPVPNGSDIFRPVIVTVSTSPPAAGETISWSNICEGNIVAADSTVLDVNGQFSIEIGGVCDVLRRRTDNSIEFTLERNDATAVCSYVFVF